MVEMSNLWTEVASMGAITTEWDDTTTRVRLAEQGDVSSPKTGDTNTEEGETMTTEYICPPCNFRTFDEEEWKKHLQECKNWSTPSFKWKWKHER
jgi:hypothetical protein